MASATSSEVAPLRAAPLACEAMRPSHSRLTAMIPEVYQGLAGLHEAALASGALNATTKELIALATPANRYRSRWSHPAGTNGSAPTRLGEPP